MAQSGNFFFYKLGVKQRGKK